LGTDFEKFLFVSDAAAVQEPGTGARRGQGTLLLLLLFLLLLVVVVVVVV
jgi:hypothetical protein